MRPEDLFCYVETVLTMPRFISQSDNVSQPLQALRSVFLLIFSFYALFSVTYSCFSDSVCDDGAGVPKCSLVEVPDDVEEREACQLQIFAGHDSSCAIVSKRKSLGAWNWRNGLNAALPCKAPTLVILRFFAYARSFAYLAEHIICDFCFSIFVRAGPAFL